MQSTAARTERELQMMEAMVDRAHELAMAFSQGAETADDPELRLKAFDAFQKGFLAVRLGVRLSEALRRRLAAGRSEGDYARAVAAHRARAAERPGTEHERCERDREDEPVSLPRFLESLSFAAAAAETRRDELPAHIRDTTLPRLQGLLAQANTDLAPAQPAQPPRAEPGRTAATLVLERPTVPRLAAGKARLLGGASLPRPPGPPPRRRDSG